MIKNKIYKNVSLKKYNSWKAGGYAENFLICADVEILSEFLRLKKIPPPFIFIGLGSNLLVRDNGVKGTVIVMYGGLSKIYQDNNLIFSDAGVSCSKLSKYVANEELSGSAFLSGIPGTIGGALAMNAGCYGSEIWDFVKKVKMINSKGNIIIKDKCDFDIGYREVINDDIGENFLGAWFNFPAGDQGKSNNEIKKILKLRRDTQPLNWPTAGSTFRNPENNYAAKVIEECGLKGYKIGMAQVSEKHANFIINLGNASASDIESLIYYIEKVVKEKTGINLMREIKIIGKSLG